MAKTNRTPSAGDKAPLAAIAAYFRKPTETAKEFLEQLNQLNLREGCPWRPHAIIGQISE